MQAFLIVHLAHVGQTLRVFHSSLVRQTVGVVHLPQVRLAVAIMTVPRISQAIGVMQMAGIRGAFATMTCLPVCIALSVMQLAQITGSITVTKCGSTFADILAMQLAQIRKTITVMHAALLSVTVVRIMNATREGLAVFLILYGALVAWSFFRPRTLDFGCVGDRHFWRLVATEYLCFFFRHGSPQQIVTSATCRQQSCLQ
jgi:small-conductance mechanosensitive channel